jgi:hypothetical protein
LSCYHVQDKALDEDDPCDIHIEEVEGKRDVEGPTIESKVISAPIKINKVNIETSEKPKMASIGDYWDEQIVESITEFVEIAKTTKRGGVNQLSLCLNNIKSIKPFVIFHQVTINIIHHMENINNEHQSHIRYTQRHIFMRKPIK